MLKKNTEESMENFTRILESIKKKNQIVTLEVKNRLIKESYLVDLRTD